MQTLLKTRAKCSQLLYLSYKLGNEARALFQQSKHTMMNSEAACSALKSLLKLQKYVLPRSTNNMRLIGKNYVTFKT